MPSTKFISRKLSSNKKISIVIVNYNVKDFLLRCLKSIYTEANLLLPIEVIIIDNNSRDDSVSAVKKNFPQVILIENKTNAGFPAANNQGFKIATGDFIFMLNPDTELVGNALSVMQNYLDKNPDVGIVTPMLLNSDGTLQRSVVKFPKIRYILAQMLYLKIFTRSKYYLDKNPEEIFQVDSASGAALFFKRSLLETTGTLNENLFWIEDIDFCYRVNRAGKKVIYLPLAKVIHHLGKSARTDYRVSISNQVTNKIKFYKIYHSAPELFIVYLVSVLNAVLRLGIFTLLSPFSRTFFLKMKAYGFTIPQIFKATKNLNRTGSKISSYPLRTLL